MSIQVILPGNKSLREVAKDVRKARRATERERRVTHRLMAGIKKDLDRILPNIDVVEAVDLLFDDDIVWSGDFDQLRHSLGSLLLHVDKSGLFAEDVQNITQVLLDAPLRGATVGE